MTDALHIVCHKPLFVARATALDPGNIEAALAHIELLDRKGQAEQARSAEQVYRDAAEARARFEAHAPAKDGVVWLSDVVARARLGR